MVPKGFRIQAQLGQPQVCRSNGTFFLKGTLFAPHYSFALGKNFRKTIRAES
jgi:hypothetical protein